MITTEGLINPEDLSESNLLETTRKMLEVVHEIADKYPTRDMELMEQLVDGQGRVEQRIGEVESSIQTLSSDIDAGFGRLEKKLETEIGSLRDEMEGLRDEMGGLRNDVNQQLNEQTELLRTIARNTQRD